MASLVSDVERLLKVLGNFGTRDKFMKAWQFGLRAFLAYGPFDSGSDQFKRLARLQATLGLARAPWRFLNELGDLIKAQAAIRQLLSGNLDNAQTLETALELAKASLMFIHWTTGHSSFLQKIGFWTRDQTLGRTAAELNRMSMTAWMFATLIGVYQTHMKLKNTPAVKAAERKELVLLQVRNVLDVLTAAGSTGHLPLSDGQVGLCGFISAALVVQRQYALAKPVGNRLN